MTVDVLLTCTGCTSDSYLRGVYFPGGSSYFGYTKTNDGSWINAPGGECVKYFKVASADLKEGTWSGKMTVKPDSGSSFFTSPGEYLFKVGRYTASCSTPVWSTETTIAITGPSPTPTSTLTPTQTATPTHTPTNTLTHTPSVTSSPTKGTSPTRTPTATIYLKEDTIGSVGSVAGANDSQEANGNAGLPAVAGETADSGLIRRPYVLAFASVALGMAIICGVLVWERVRYIQQKKQSE